MYCSLSFENGHRFILSQHLDPFGDVHRNLLRKRPSKSGDSHWPYYHKNPSQDHGKSSQKSTSSPAPTQNAVAASIYAADGAEMANEAPTTLDPAQIQFSIHEAQIACAAC